jgi:hypothetical protein
MERGLQLQPCISHSIPITKIATVRWDEWDEIDCLHMGKEYFNSLLLREIADSIAGRMTRLTLGHYLNLAKITEVS